jgi:exopolyphosphatase/guanosine-5'-triphosphate,3'-diphosphate pyrophosphatase
VALGAGADQILIVATAAVREAPNGPAFVKLIHERLGLGVRVLSGAEEAQYALLGALYGLPCEHGISIDVGGGSMQIVHFRNRAAINTWSLPLGALRLSDAFLKTDPPTAAEVAALQEHVCSALVGAGVPTLAPDELLVGTGGTVRNLARVDRREVEYPIQKVHGYVLPTVRLRRITSVLVERSQRARQTVIGLNEDRADSIAGGALAVQTVVEQVQAEEIVVSGQGLREGIVHGLLAPTLPRPAIVRQTSLRLLAGRFSSWTAVAADRRRAIACAIASAVPPSNWEAADALGNAAYIVDVGRSMDYYRRFTHAADIVQAADLAGFSHRALAFLIASLRAGAGGKVRLKSLAPLLSRRDEADIEWAGAILAFADEMEYRCEPARRLAVSCIRRNDEIVLSVPLIQGSSISSVQARLEKATGSHLRLEIAGAEA